VRRGGRFVLLGLLLFCLSCSGGAKPSVEAGDASLSIDVTSLPFAIDDHFVPSGYLGDAVDGPLTLAEEGCGARVEGAQGRCHRYAYGTTPGIGWASVFWQYGDGNWGSQPGLSVAPGALRVSFVGRSLNGSLSVRITIGGISDAELPYQDSFTRESELTLTADRQRFEVDLAGVAYDAVIGAFGWTLDAPNAGSGHVIELDDLRWE
jgi:hypothetical protein